MNMKRKRDRKPDEPTFRFDRWLLGIHITRRSGTRSWRQFEQDNAILSTLAENGQTETLRMFKDGEIGMPELRSASQRDQLSSGSLVLDIKVREKLWGEDGAFESALPKMGRVDSTRQRYKVSMLALARRNVLGADAMVTDLQFVDWGALRERWGKSGSDWNHLRRMLSKFLTVQMGSKHHPFRHIVLAAIERRPENERVPDLTVEKFWEVVAAAPDHVRAAFVVLVATGMRWGEYERLRKSHLKPTTLAVDIPGTKTGASSGRVYVQEWLWPWMEAGTPAPLAYRWTRTHWDRACKAVGVEDVTLHDLRHLHGQIAINAVDISKVADGLRHTQLSTTRRYTRQRNRQDVANAVGEGLQQTTTKLEITSKKPTSRGRRASNN